MLRPVSSSFLLLHMGTVSTEELGCLHPSPQPEERGETQEKVWKPIIEKEPPPNKKEDRLAYQCTITILF